MIAPARKDFVSLAVDERGAYTNGKQRKQSYWRKWKQLSSLQRSLILFVLVLLLISGVVVYPGLLTHWGAQSDTVKRSSDGDRVQAEIETISREKAVLPEPPSEQKNGFRKRGPPVLQNRLQNKGNVSEAHRVEMKTGVEDGNKSLISWGGAVLKKDEDKDATKKEAEDASVEASRLEAAREAFRHAWKGYKDFAWGHDELKPISKSYTEWFGLGLTLIDALDTMWILGLKEEFEEARQWVATHLSFEKSVDVNLFESTIRILGGLLSTYHLTGDALFLEKAKDVGSRLTETLLSFKQSGWRALTRDRLAAWAVGSGCPSSRGMRLPYYQTCVPIRLFVKLLMRLSPMCQEFLTRLWIPLSCQTNPQQPQMCLIEYS